MSESMAARKHVFVGFGFGPIQAGLFLKEAHASGAFERLVVAEIDQRLVDAVRANGNRYVVNVARADGVYRESVDGVEMLNPRVDRDLACLREALARATEIVTSLPSVDFYAAGTPSVASLIAQGVRSDEAPGTLVYTAENNNHAAEALDAAVAAADGAPRGRPVQFLNTVIGKMSQVVADAEAIRALGIAGMAPGIDRAFLVESFNHILVTQSTLAALKPGIGVFEEKADLLPFEEAKLYGHNAIHAVMAYLSEWRGYRRMSEAGDDALVMGVARAAFLDESGVALVRKYAGLGDTLFTEAGYRRYAADLLARMTNRHLADAVERAGRDPVRKLGLSDRIYGAMSLALGQGISPVNMGRGAAAGLMKLVSERERHGVPASLSESIAHRPPRAWAPPLLDWVWARNVCPHRDALVALTIDGLDWLGALKEHGR